MLEELSGYTVTSFPGLPNVYMSNSCECMGVNGEALQLCTVYKKPYLLPQVTCKFLSVLYYKSQEILYQVW